MLWFRRSLICIAPCKVIQESPGIRIPRCGFRIPEIPLAGFRIAQTKITWIPDSGLPYMGRYVVRSDVSVTFDEICVVVVLNKNSVQVLDFVV